MLNKRSLFDQFVGQLNFAVDVNSLNKKIQAQGFNYELAYAELEKLRDTLGVPENILGNPQTKHGEIAELLQVHVGNAYELVEGRPERRSMEDVNRIGPTDYLDYGVDVQSKFINGATGSGSLKHIIDHFEKYPDFARGEAYYHIPKDQHETILTLMAMQSSDEFNQRSVNHVLKQVSEIQNQTGRPFEDLVRPSLSEYGEVQLGVVFTTVTNHEEKIFEIHEEKLERIEVEHNTGLPELEEAAAMLGLGGLLTSAFAAGTEGYRRFKCSSGSFLERAYIDDLKAVGRRGVYGACRGGLSSSMILFLSRSASLPIPLAAAFSTIAIEITPLVYKLRNGEVTQEAFVKQCRATVEKTGINCGGILAGQAVIPIPILGALIGALGVQLSMVLIQKYTNDPDQKLLNELEKSYEKSKEFLGSNWRKTLSIFESASKGLAEALGNIQGNFQELQKGSGSFDSVSRRTQMKIKMFSSVFIEKSGWKKKAG
jgi:hypothetical protein